ncbi:MAG: YegS/Rv2252/BmrU family lipid kinase [Bacteroidetes bacterium]|nr:YegS/Rv2252/BmrU family lipid kinase [Bacteroidota bacterium]
MSENPAVFINIYSGKGLKILKIIKQIIESDKLAIPVFTNATSSTKEVLQKISKKHSTLFVVGGDGTCNNVINNIDLKKNKVAFIPAGTGNDFVKMLKQVPLRNLLNNSFSTKVIESDVWSVELDDNQKQYFINGLGFGLDADVAYSATKIKWLKGFPKYLFAAIKTLFTITGREIRIITNSESITSTISFCAIGNGQYAGGGFKLTPEANISDSQLDICLVKIASTFTLFKLLPRSLMGTHILNPLVKYFKDSEIKIECDGGIPLHADGELLGRNIKWAKINLISDKLKVIVAD